MNCPSCGAEQQDFAVECARCGIVFSKWVAPQFTRKAKLEREHQRVEKALFRPQDGRIGRAELLVLVPGLIAAIVVYAIPFLRLVASALVTLFHELGHAVVGWIFGYPSIPAFDFTYGGGITPRGEFHVTIALAIAAGFGYLAYRYRRNKHTLTVLGTVFLIWLFFVTSEWRREIVISAAGHASELILAAIFFYMALAGVGFRMPEIERPLGAFMAFFVTINSIMFAHRLRNDPDFLEWYREGKAGALMNDLESVALDLRIHLGAVKVEIGTVAGWLIAFSIVPFAVAMGWHFYRSRCHAVARLILDTR